MRVMEMVFSRLSVLPVTGYSKSMCYAVLLPSVLAKAKGSNEQVVAVATNH